MKKKAPKASSRYPTPALEKGLDILELFASEPSGLTKSDVARRLGRTVSEIFRMLVCLEERGYISQSHDEERYRLTLRLFRLAQEYPPTKRMTGSGLRPRSDCRPSRFSTQHWLLCKGRAGCRPHACSDGARNPGASNS